MFEKFTAANAGDFRQRYQGTFGFFIDGDKKTLSQLTEVGTGGSRPGVVFHDRNGEKYLLRSDSTQDRRGFEFLPPKSAWYNTKDGVALLVSRVPARQYQRGLCSKNTSLRDTADIEYPVDFKNLIKIFEDRVTVQEALATVLKNSGNPHLGIAISPQFAINIAFKTIKCFATTIGEVIYSKVDEVFTVTLNSPDLWGIEVKDAFARSNLKVVIK